MIGFLLALNAMLLTVPERRRFIAELRMQGYDPRQIVLLLGFQALALGVVASLIGVGAGELLSHALFQRTPSFLSAAFPIGTEEIVHPGTVLLAIGCGVLATALASLSPLLDLRSGRPADAVFRETGHGQRDRRRAHDLPARAGRRGADRARARDRPATRRARRSWAAWRSRSRCLCLIPARLRRPRACAAADRGRTCARAL